MIRTAPDGKIYGRNEIDPLIWQDSVYFLSGESRGRLEVALKRVTALADAEVKRCSAAQRALVQNRVWTVFDHVRIHTAARSVTDRAYLQLLARTMAKLVLDKNEIASIADPLSQAAASGRWPSQPAALGGPDIFLPPEIAEENGPWITLGRDDGWVTAKEHTIGFGGRSAFILRAKFPKGSVGAASYFKSLAAFPTPWLLKEVPDGPRRPEFVPHPDLPELPVGTEFALIRRLAVIDRVGEWQSTPMTLSVQFRRYHVTSRKEFERLIGEVGFDQAWRNRLQSFAQFDLETTAVGEGGPAFMKPVRSDEKSWFFMFQMGPDQVDGDSIGPKGSAVYCVQCHSQVGTESVNSLMFPGNAHTVPGVGLAPITAQNEAERAAAWKTERAEWGALQAFWPAAETTAPVH